MHIQPQVLLFQEQALPPANKSDCLAEQNHNPKLESFCESDCIACHQSHSLSESTHEAPCEMLSKACCPLAELLLV